MADNIIRMAHRVWHDGSLEVTERGEGVFVLSGFDNNSDTIGNYTDNTWNVERKLDLLQRVLADVKKYPRERLEIAAFGKNAND